MALLNRKVDYALLILHHLNRRAEGSCARAIAGDLGLSPAFVANILKTLCRREFVTSQRGLHGGYRLKRPAREIALADLMDALASRVHLAECCQEHPESRCELYGTCPIRGPVAELDRRIGRMLETVTLADLFPAEGVEVAVELETSRCLASPERQPSVAPCP